MNLSDYVDRGQTNYRSYLLRLWWVEEGETPALRILVEDSLTGKRTGFSNLKELIAFLSKEANLEEYNQKKSSPKDPQDTRNMKA